MNVEGSGVKASDFLQECQKAQDWFFTGFHAPGVSLTAGLTCFVHFV